MIWRTGAKLESFKFINILQLRSNQLWQFSSFTFESINWDNQKE